MAPWSITPHDHITPQSEPGVPTISRETDIHQLANSPGIPNRDLGVMDTDMDTGHYLFK